MPEMKKLIGLVVMLSLFVVPVEAKVKVVIFGQEMHDFWHSGTYEPYLYTLAAVGCMYGGYSILTKTKNPDALDYAGGTFLLLSGSFGPLQAVGFNIYW